jgi:hypothetical protein
MAQSPIAAEIHKPLDVHRGLSPKIAFDDKIAVDDFADLQHFLIGQLRHPTLVRESSFVHDFVGLGGPDSMDVLQGDQYALVGRYIDSGDAGHGLNSCCRPAKWRLGSGSSLRA